MINIGILASYNGSGFIALHKACQKGILNARISVVISNNFDANVLKTAQNENITHYCINSKLFPNESISSKLIDIFQENQCEYIFLSGYMKKIDSILLNSYPNKIINCHPSLLPKFGGKGMYGRFVHNAVIQSKETKSGVTVHFINENYDEGKYIVQKELKLINNETVDSLENKIKELEKTTIIEAFKLLIK